MRSKRPLSSAADYFSDSDKDSIDLHISKRQARLEELANGSDSESDTHDASGSRVVEKEVYDIELSESEDEQVLPEPSVANIANDSDDDEGEEIDEDDYGDWGGRRRKYYGVDTDEFEIMEEDERIEALQEEEEEAVRLQKKQLSTLQASDYADDDDDDVTDEEEDGEEVSDAAECLAKPISTAPEVSALAKELQKYFQLLKAWKGRQKWGDVAKTRYHLYAAYVSNIAFYFALLSDPESASIDARDHPVVKRIVELRQLIIDHETIEVKKSQRVNPKNSENHVAGVKAKEPASQTAEEAEVRVNAAADEGRGDHAELQNKEQTSSVQKKKKQRQADAQTARSARKAGVKLDDEMQLVQSLLKRSNSVELTPNATKGGSSQKQRKLNRITGALDSQAKNDAKRRVISADMDHEWNQTGPKKQALPSPETGAETSNEVEGNDLATLGDEEFVEHMLQKNQKKSGRKKRKEADAPHVYTFNDSANVGDRRRASTQVVLNRGLTRYRPKEKKTPRTKNKLAYAKAVKRRKGMVRDAVAVKPGVSYGGESSGINVNARRGAKLSDF